MKHLRLWVFVLLTVSLVLVPSSAADGVAPNWLRVNASGFGEGGNSAINSLAPFGNQLYAAATNYQSGAQVWRTSDGRNWTSYWDNSVLAWGDRLFVGTWNLGAGGEVWMYLPNRVVLPVVRKG